MAATRTPPPGLQLSWLDGEALAWQPGRGVYGGNLHQEVARTVRRPARDFTASNRVVSMEVPDPVRGGTTRLDVMCQRLDATALAATALGLAHEVIQAAGPVDAVGITTQRASTVVWDRATGTPLSPGLGWQDLRTVGE